MKTSFFYLLSSAAIFGLLFLFTSCEPSDGMRSGRVQLFLTDSPIDADNVAAVNITITRIDYQRQGEEWKTLENFEGPLKVNLLDLQNGETEFLAEFSAGPGVYNGFRFYLDAAERNGGPLSNPGTYIEFVDGSTQALFVPSGSQSGYKTVGQFTVPSNGTVQVIADFDVRKSVVVAGNSGMYLLKPTIRIIVDNQAGQITGEVAPIDPDLTYVVYSYTSGTYNEDELTADEDGNIFANAVSSARVADDGKYILAFLASGTYDLVVASYLDGEFQEVLKVAEGIEVNSNEITERNIDITPEPIEEDSGE